MPVTDDEIISECDMLINDKDSLSLLSKPFTDVSEEIEKCLDNNNKERPLHLMNDSTKRDHSDHMEVDKGSEAVRNRATFEAEAAAKSDCSESDEDVGNTIGNSYKRFKLLQSGKHFPIIDSDEDNELIENKRNDTELIELTDKTNKTEQSLEPPQKKSLIQNEAECSNSKWTLKYQKAEENVIELINGSAVFVSKFELQTVKDTCKKQSELARALLKVVFTKTALNTCSMTGKQSKGYHRSENIKPGLDSNGLEAIIQFSAGYAKKKNWECAPRSLITKSISSKLNEIKAAIKQNQQYIKQ